MPTKKTEVATVSPADLPGAALPSMYAATDSTDMRYPGLRLVHPLSQAAVARPRIAEPGQMIIGLGPDDPDPFFLIDDEHSSALAYVLHSRKGAGRSLPGTKIEFADRKPSSDPEREWWDIFWCTLIVPEFSITQPVTWMLWKSGRRAYQNINYCIESAIASGLPVPAIVISVGETTGNNGTYFVPQVASGQPDSTIEAVAALQSRLSSVIRNQPFADDSPETATATAYQDQPSI